MSDNTSNHNSHIRCAALRLRPAICESDQKLEKQNTQSLTKTSAESWTFFVVGCDIEERARTHNTHIRACTQSRAHARTHALICTHMHSYALICTHATIARMDHKANVCDEGLFQHSTRRREPIQRNTVPPDSLCQRNSL
eukprot:3963794-Amphidinium_carterae.1